MQRKKIAVIGAGASGLMLARNLTGCAEVHLYEASESVGGRLATKMSPQGAYFDSGAQFFVAKESDFQSFLKPFIEEGSLGIWQGRFAEINIDRVVCQRNWTEHFPHYVGVPSMRDWCQSMANGLSIKLNHEVRALERDASQSWSLHTSTRSAEGPFDVVLLAVTLERARMLLPKSVCFIEALESYQMEACFSLSMRFPESMCFDWEAALIRGNLMSWVSVDSSKPGRSGSNQVVMLSTNAFANQHKNEDPQWVKETLLSALRSVLKWETHQAPIDVVLNFWPEANAGLQKGPSSLWDPDMRIGACGDWCIQGTVRAAYESVRDLCEKISNS